jgi:hydrogenase maturation protein HypF
MSLAAPGQTRRRVAVGVTGTVQGVGFRPHVYRLAVELELSGFVLNDAHGVKLEVEGSAARVSEFLRRLRDEAPPLAVLESVRVVERPSAGGTEFLIRPSPQGERPDAAVTPDTATCERCLAELFDPGDRRFRYPFVNCTNCGPRFTIVRGVPYDRPATTMAGFEMCPACRREYEDPTDRRFHAQPNACPACGPQVQLVNAAGGLVSPHGAADAVHAAAGALREGAILAVKGIGGYHLACLADHPEAVARLRGRKHREDKPFALIVGSLAAAAELVELRTGERELITSPARPIVLAHRRADAAVAEAVAPGAHELGVMLPYSPLHHLLLADVGQALVLTSGNLSEEPIAHDDADARVRLAELADLFLIHDRPIETRTDDSVVRAVRVAGSERQAVLRRSRGFVPGALPLPGATSRALLGCGAELKNTFCLARDEHAWVSHHIGDLENFATLESFTTGIEHFERLFAVVPEIVAHDLHPEYLSTKYALEREGVELVGVQHHHAHMAACLAEHGEPGPAISAVFDGTGYGLDGTVWGGELLYGDCSSFERVGALRGVPLPGGERAIREPWRMACAWLEAAGISCSEVWPAMAEEVSSEHWRAVLSMVRGGLASPQTSSMGRLFDAVAALCGLRASVNYEGQAAIELERACDPRERGLYPIGVSAGEGGIELDPRPAIRAAAADLAAGVGVGVVAARFHAGVGAATIEACLRTASARGVEVAVLSGGVFQNRRLLEAVADGLAVAGMRVLIPERLPANDGGIAFGQVAVAAARLRSAACPS